jgi:hypothetical protein
MKILANNMSRISVARRLACVWARLDVPALIGADTPAR